MSWSDTTRRRWLGLTLPALLSLSAGGCGFRPLYAGDAGGKVSNELAAIEVRTPTTRIGQYLKNQLIDDLNPAGVSVAKLYQLDVELRRTEKALAIQLDDNITRFDLTLAAFISLNPLGAEPVALAPMDEELADEVDVATDEEPDRAPPLYRSAVRRVSSYNVVQDPFATLIAEQNAEERAAVELSRNIRTLLTLYFQNHPA